MLKLHENPRADGVLGESRGAATVSPCDLALRHGQTHPWPSKTLSRAFHRCKSRLAWFGLPNVQDEPRPWLARLVLLGARDVTAMVVGSGALLGGLGSIGGPSFPMSNNPK